MVVKAILPRFYNLGVRRVLEVERADAEAVGQAGGGGAAWEPENGLVFGRVLARWCDEVECLLGWV